MHLSFECWRKCGINHFGRHFMFGKTHCKTVNVCNAINPFHKPVAAINWHIIVGLLGGNWCMNVDNSHKTLIHICHVNLHKTMMKHTEKRNFSLFPWFFTDLHFYSITYTVSMEAWTVTWFKSTFELNSILIPIFSPFSRFFFFVSFSPIRKKWEQINFNYNECPWLRQWQ